MKTRGFTLVELLLTLAIIVIFAGYFIWQAKAPAQTTKTVILREKMFHAINYAREQAVLSNKMVTFCQSHDFATCATEGAAGFLVVSGDKILAVFHVPMQDGVMRQRFFPAHITTLQFSADGNTAAENGAFWYCINSASAPRFAIFISKTGRPRIALPDAHDEIRDEHGKLLGC